MHTCPANRCLPAGSQPLTASRHSRGNSRLSVAPESSLVGRPTTGFSNHRRCRVPLQPMQGGQYRFKIANLPDHRVLKPQALWLSLHIGPGPVTWPALSSQRSWTARVLKPHVHDAAAPPGRYARQRVLHLNAVHVLYHVVHALAQEVVKRVHMRLRNRSRNRRLP